MPKLTLLPVQLVTILLSAFLAQGFLIVASAAAAVGTLALTLRFRLAVPLGVAMAQVAGGILLTTLDERFLPVSLATMACAFLTALAPRRHRAPVRDTLRPAVFALTGLSALSLLLRLF